MHNLFITASNLDTPTVTLSCSASTLVIFVFVIFSSLLARMMESMSHEVELRSAEPEIIELLIEFIYTAR